MIVTSMRRVINAVDAYRHNIKVYSEQPAVGNYSMGLHTTSTASNKESLNCAIKKALSVRIGWAVAVALCKKTSPTLTPIY